MRLPYEEPRHECSRCKPGFPPENDGALPWRDEDGNWHTECPWPELQEAVRMVGFCDEYNNGRTPITLGWCSVVTSQLRDAAVLVRAERNIVEARISMKKEPASG